MKKLLDLKKEKKKYSLSNIDCAWLAGVIDCDGSLFFKNGFCKDKRAKHLWRSRRTNIIVVNSSVDLVKRAQGLIDGSFEIVHKYGSKDSLANDGFRKKTIYRTLQSHHDRVFLLLKKIYPYLVAKKEYASKMIEFIELTDWRKWSPEAIERREKMMKKIWKQRRKK